MIKLQKSVFILSGLFCLMLLQGKGQTSVGESNESSRVLGVVRIIQPGVFDYQSRDYLVRMRAWGVEFPLRNQPGYNEAIHFTEKNLLNKNLEFVLKQEFDLQNLKVVDIYTGVSKENFSQLAIEEGIGRHIESETDRNGKFSIAQLKAKRKALGIWKYGDLFQQKSSQFDVPHPLLKTVVEQNPFSPGLNYWVTSFGKIHRPECSFYERGRGELSRRPTGSDCRICGGTKPDR